MWLPSATTTYSWGIKCGTPSCEMIYWTWNRTWNEKRELKVELERASDLFIELSFLSWTLEHEVFESNLCHLVVSCHQVLNCLSIYGGYLLNVCALLLQNANINAFSYNVRSINLLHAKKRVSKNCVMLQIGRDRPGLTASVLELQWCAPVPRPAAALE